MTCNEPPFSIGGYVLAGGRSSRMGRDKALIHLAGKPLIEHAVTKLRRICTHVHLLTSDIALAAFAPILPDIHLNCGPIGGIETALMQTSNDWNLFLPVDMPLLPLAFLKHWVQSELSSPTNSRPGVRIFTVGDRPQPGLCLVHKAILPTIAHAVSRKEFALISVFEEVAREENYTFHASPLRLSGQFSSPKTGTMRQLTSAQIAAQHLWFLNLNTKGDLALAAASSAALDT